MPAIAGVVAAAGLPLKPPLIILFIFAGILVGPAESSDTGLYIGWPR